MFRKKTLSPIKDVSTNSKIKYFVNFYIFKASYGYAVNQISEPQRAYVHGGPHKRDFGAAEYVLFGQLFK